MLSRVLTLPFHQSSGSGLQSSLFLGKRLRVNCCEPTQVRSSYIWRSRIQRYAFRIWESCYLTKSAETQNPGHTARRIHCLWKSFDSLGRSSSLIASSLVFLLLLSLLYHRECILVSILSCLLWLTKSFEAFVFNPPFPKLNATTLLKEI